MRTQLSALSLLALAPSIRCALLPYNPTRILLSPNSTFVYIFRPSTGSSNQAQLLSLDFSTHFSTKNHGLSTLSDALPFLEEEESLAYSPSIDASGNITVVAGNCSQGAHGTQVWQYTKESGDSRAGSGWTQHGTASQDLGDNAVIAGANFLSNTLAFSPYLGSSSTLSSIYTFGGMCPYRNSTAETWISSAEYSNLMLTLSPDTSTGDDTQYDLSFLQNRGPPIAQAGTSLTPLPPTYSMDSSGAPQSQAQDFVLLGGQTESAFINMSQVALYSLPQETWSFMPVQQPSNVKSDLATRRSIQQVSPRSGHTAVLSDDGNTIILFGGWVGDVNTPADPQLAVLELGSGYGGSGDWKWTIPDQSGIGLTAGSGIYGHGAAMLPGGVMMILGGYEIAGSSSRRLKRDSQTANSKLLLYNMTSNSWISSYTPPQNLGEQSGDNSGLLSKTSEKVGLGTGLGIGAALLVSVLVFYFWYSRRVKRAREQRARALLTYSSDGSSVGQMEQHFLNSGGIDGRGGDETALGRLWPTGDNAGSSNPRQPSMQHTTGMWVDVPSPTRGLRKGVAGKSYQYHAAPRYDDKRMSRGSGKIHPIAELENEDGSESQAGRSEQDRLSDAETKLREAERMLNNSEDPFRDPEPNPLGSHPVSPVAGDTLRRVPTGASHVSPIRRKPVPSPQDEENWTVERGPDEGLYEADDRTSSNLSERSQRSAASANSITRTMSTRTGAIMAAAAAAHRNATSPEHSPQEERSNTMSSIASRQSQFLFKTRARSNTGDSITPITPRPLSGLRVDGDSFIAVGSGFTQLQSEGEALLGGRPAGDPDDPYSRALAAQGNPDTSASANAGPLISPRRRPGLLGSLRRALNAMSMGERTFSLTGASEQYKDDMRSSSSSPTKEQPGKLAGGPRRAVSDGGVLRQKRGQKDWEEKAWPPYRDDPDAEDWGEPKSSFEKRQAEEEWDVEGAANRRDFQVMFTVPKARLRVVNDDMDRASLRSASDSAVSRNGSFRDVRREDSIKVAKARADGLGAPRLPSTEEEGDDAEKCKAA